MADFIKCATCGGLFSPEFLDQVFEHEHDLLDLSVIIKGKEVVEWNIGDRFTTPETGAMNFTVTEISEHYVDARDRRSRSGTTSFAKSYIKKVNS